MRVNDKTKLIKVLVLLEVYFAWSPWIFKSFLIYSNVPKGGHSKVKAKTLFTILAGMLLLAMIFKAVPWDHSTWNKTFYVTSNIQPGDLYAEKKVLSELKQIREEIDDSQRSYSPEMIYSHLLRLVTLRNHTQDPYLTERIRVVLEYASHTRSAQNRYSDLSFKLSKLVNNEEYKKATSFSPTTNHIDLGPLWQYETQN